ncbi:MAG: thiamine pyrophosphate-dependent enzyme [Anaerolineae bacterium]|jgi:indolepyruvate ferredoxin oxidoreductase alpha subunit
MVVTKQLITGNEAVALGALRAGVKVVTGYPGTPSSGALGSLMTMPLDDARHVEWSTNEKVALEIAAGAAWAGQRAMCTMKMSGVNVASDALFSIAHSGVNGALVIYVADDPGAHAGMVEQDSRGYARMMDLPVIEPTTVAEAYSMMPLAFELSERCGSPVFVRSVTAIANSHAAVAVEDAKEPEQRDPILERDITKYTKAGSAIAQAQHRQAIVRLEKAGEIVREMGLNELTLSKRKGGLGIVASGVSVSYLNEGLRIAAEHGCDRDRISLLSVRATNPFPDREARALLEHCDEVVVLEELEPYLEERVILEAYSARFEGPIVGKLDGTLERVGEYGVRDVVRGIGAALDLALPEDLSGGNQHAEEIAATRPITVCAGCPHRGTYMAINQALRNLGLRKDEVMVTGDIGCTILGMNEPFETVWNEVAMGSSISLAQGYVYSGLETPVIATIGDSTFFHAGMPGLINAVQHSVPLTLIVMDNGWTAMTGMQTNPGTEAAFQPPGNRRVDLAEVIPAMGVEQFFMIDPFELDEATAVVEEALGLPGVKVVLSRQECAIQAQRRGLEAGVVEVDAEACTLCKRCITVTGCPAISLGEETVLIDQSLCYGCGLCAQVCSFDAIHVKREATA